MKLSKSMEDYLEAVYVIAKNKKVVRVKDVGAFLKVRNPSVIKAMRGLEENGLVRHEHYGYIELTSGGTEYARNIYDRHVLIMNFFTRILKVPMTIAEEDACIIEHYLHKVTMSRLRHFMKYIVEETDFSSDQFDRYYEEGAAEQR